MNRIRFWWQYIRRKTPWDTQIVPPEIVALVDTLPAGRALDIGCGTGTTSLYLATYGWDVVGVDFVPAAIRQARRKADLAKYSVRFYVANAAKLDFLTEPVDFAIDIGCLHSLSLTDQHDYAAHLARLTVVGAVYALYAFTPRVIGSRKTGLTVEAIRALFAPNFQLDRYTPGKDKGTGPTSGWYYLHRT